MLTIWGVVCTLQGIVYLLSIMMLNGRLRSSKGVVKGYAGLLACRFFLGLIEGA